MTKGAVDKVDTSKLITLSAEQNIPGTITFENLELTEVLNVSVLNVMVDENVKINVIFVGNGKHHRKRYGHVSVKPYPE